MESRPGSSIPEVGGLEAVDEAHRQVAHQANRLRVYKSRRGVS